MAWPRVSARRKVEYFVPPQSIGSRPIENGKAITVVAPPDVPVTKVREPQPPTTLH